MLERYEPGRANATLIPCGAQCLSAKQKCKCSWVVDDPGFSAKWAVLCPGVEYEQGRAREGANTEEREGRVCEGKKETESGGELHRSKGPATARLISGTRRRVQVQFGMQVQSICGFALRVHGESAFFWGERRAPFSRRLQALSFPPIQLWASPRASETQAVILPAPIPRDAVPGTV